jgi:hypothetical protein
MKLHDFKNTQMPSTLKKKALSDAWFLAYCQTDKGDGFYQTYKAGMLLEPKTNRYVLAIAPIDASLAVLFENIPVMEGV